ncbi:glycosyltransferase involved in cell wall biosynthesis [Kineothrix alysoides]|uniref:Glycosyltransferase involved in cell wall biosynthesis n=1 Tax=Kineothrix alysoides TaxID=1469948 RepID=A0A4R1R1Z6_9FIRM|nr:glycosyltransferase family A protein [Kineothrix alysoides]TCL59375.1 glycosyltransferase involved in cell wall biosynthesis [Kineothrix alysoides]
MDKVSIIMPCYNDGKYIVQAIDSVKKQTYPDVELIIIDDGSDEKKTLKILEEIAKDKNILVLRTERLRPAGARNFGIQAATGKYILPLDADDLIDRTYVQKAVHILQTYKDIGVVYCFADLFGKKTGKWDLPAYSFKNMLIDNIVFVTAMFRREDWESVGGFDTSMDEGMEDYAFWISILEQEKEIYQIPETLFHYRIKEESRTTKFLSDIDKTKVIYERIYHNHKAFYEKHAEEYAMALRESLIEQIYVRRKYERRFEKFQLLKNISFIRWIVRKTLKEL